MIRHGWAVACLAGWMASSWLGSRWAAAESVAAGAPVPMELTVVGGPELNPNGSGRASPVMVRIFDLASGKAFESADYPALFDHAAETLQPDLLAQDEFTLRPGEMVQRNRELSPQVRLIGIAAGFRDIEHGVWHLVVPITPGRRNFLLIDLDHNTIRLMPVEP